MSIRLVLHYMSMWVLETLGKLGSIQQMYLYVCCTVCLRFMVNQIAHNVPKLKRLLQH